MFKETVPLDSTGHLLHKATPQTLGVIANVSNTWRQIQRGSQNGESKKHAPIERIRKISRKIAKQNGSKQFMIFRVQKKWL